MLAPSFLASSWPSLGQFPIIAAVSQLIIRVVHTLTLESTRFPIVRLFAQCGLGSSSSSKRPCVLWLKIGIMGRPPGFQEGSQGISIAKVSRWQWPVATQRGKLVFPALRTANRGGSQCHSCYPMYRYCYKWHQSLVHCSLGLLARWQFLKHHYCSKQSVCSTIQLRSEVNKLYFLESCLRHTESRRSGIDSVASC